MTQILSRGENVYICDVCNRRVRVPENRRGLDVINRCIITKNCAGSLHKVITQADIVNTPTLTPAIEGLDDWYQRNALFDYKQTVKSKVWRVPHKMGTIPAVQVFVYRTDPDTMKQVLVETRQGTVVSTPQQTTITFDTAVDGVVQCLALSSNTKQDTTATAAPTDIITSNGELTIATSSPSDSVNLIVRFTDTFTGEFTDVTYTSLLNQPNPASPWVGVETVLVNGKRFYVRSLNIQTSPRGSAYFDALERTTSGLAVSFPTAELSFSNTLILLGRPPYGAADRITDRYIDMGRLKSVYTAVYLVGYDIAVESRLISNVYPHIVAL